MLKTFYIFFKNPKKCKENNFKEALLPNFTMSRRPPSSPYGFFRTEFHNKNLDASSKNIYKHPDLTAIVEIVANKFYFATLLPGRKKPKGLPNFYLFDIDDELIYYSFYDDFGPLNIACLYKYCHGVNHILKNPEHKLETIVHYTSTNFKKRANATFLAASYLVLYQKQSPEEAYHKVSCKDFPILKPFQDASSGPSSYTIKLSDCLHALKKASVLGFFNFEDFDLREYEKYEQVKNGDLSWIIPRKCLAFLGPNTDRESNAHYPEKYLNYFMKNEVTAVIRLNQKAYESFRFKNAGIAHYDMFFPDGSAPPLKILKHFLQVLETTKGAIAVHCKAGLGRTGTLIAAYLMKHYRMTAREAIAWLRICRPGSVVGHQQSWLEEMESSLWQEGSRYRLKYHGDYNLVLHHKTGIYSIEAKMDKKAQHNYLKILRANEAKKLDPRVRCASAREGESYRHASKHEKNLYGDENNKITQGDKLNKLKIKREENKNELNSNTFTIKSQKNPILRWRNK